MKRMEVIDRVAAVVGPPHKVDLKNFDLLILVEIYRVRNLPHI
jgi:tRNA acetyltransferase TAN1